LVKLKLLLPSNALENGTEFTDEINVSYIPVVFSEDAEGIRLEYHTIHKPFSYATDLLIYV
jgi:hypothetical protein